MRPYKPSGNWVVMTIPTIGSKQVIFDPSTYCWWFRNPAFTSCGWLFFPIIHKVLAPSQVVGNGISESSRVWLLYASTNSPNLQIFRTSKNSCTASLNAAAPGEDWEQNNPTETPIGKQNQTLEEINSRSQRVVKVAGKKPSIWIRFCRCFFSKLREWKAKTKKNTETFPELKKKLFWGEHILGGEWFFLDQKIENLQWKIAQSLSYHWGRKGWADRWNSTWITQKSPQKHHIWKEFPNQHYLYLC